MTSRGLVVVAVVLLVSRSAQAAGGLSGLRGKDDGLSKEDIQTVMHQLKPGMKKCHQWGVKRANADVEGKIKVGFVIDPEGKVLSAEAQENTFTTKDKTFQECVVGLVLGAKFPKPRGGIQVTVSYPFLFKMEKKGK